MPKMETSSGQLQAFKDIFIMFWNNLVLKHLGVDEVAAIKICFIWKCYSHLSATSRLNPDKPVVSYGRNRSTRGRQRPYSH